MASGHNNLYVCGLPDGLDESVFRSMFEAYGTILSCKCMSDKRYGFVKFATEGEAQMAIQGLSGFELSGSQIQVRVADNDRGQKGKGMGDDWGGKGGWDGGDGGWGGGGQKGGFDGGYGGYKGAQKGGSSYSSPKGDGKADSAPSDNLYIKGLPLGSTEQTVHQIFGAYGAVTSCKVLSHVDGASTAAAMVRMGSVDQATWLVQNLNGNIPQGLTDAIQVKFANSGGGKGKKDEVFAWGTEPQPGYGAPVMGALPPGAPSSWSTLAPPPPQANPALMDTGSPQDNLYIKGLPVGVTDELVREIFGAYGAINSIKCLQTPDGADNAAALVRFNDVAQAVWLVDNLNGNIPKGLSTPVIVRYANGKGKGKDGGKGEGKDDRFSPYGKGGAMAPAPLPINFGHGEEGSNLYIRGLPPTADDLYLYKVFAPVGAILSVKAIMSPETTQCAGYGFVKYVTAEEGQKAIALMSSTPLPDGNMLMVTVKSPGKGKGKDKNNGIPQFSIPQPPMASQQYLGGGLTDFAALAASDPEAAAALKALSS